MKKLAYLLLLNLILFKPLYGKVVNIGSDIKLNIPKGYGYIESSWIDHFKIHEPETYQKSLESAKEIGFQKSDSIILIGTKKFVKNYKQFIEDAINYPNIQDTESGKKIINKCGRKRTVKSQNMCIIKFLDYDLVLVAGVGSLKVDGIDELNSYTMDENLADEKLVAEIKEFNKQAETFEVKSRGIKSGPVSFKKIKNSKFAVHLDFNQKMYGLKAKGTLFLFPHKSSFFIFTSTCVTKKNCEKLDKLTYDVLGPYLYNSELKVPNKKDIASKLEKLNDLYKKGLLTNEEFERAKELILF